MTAKKAPVDPKVKRRKAQIKKIWKKTKIYIIFVIAVFAFAILGLLPNSGGIVSGGVAAMVNGEAISRADFSRAVQQEEQRLGSLLGNITGEYRQRMMMQLRQSALQRLISLELIKQMAAEHGIYASDEEIRDLLVENKAFHENDRFSQEKYFSLLKANRIKPSDYEEDLRQQAVTQKLLSLFSASVVNTDTERTVQASLLDSKVNIGFVKFNKANLKVNSSNDEIAQYVKDNKDKVDEYYKTNKAEFTQDEQVKARHILVKVADKKDTKKADEKIKQAIERLKTEPFEKVAKEMSEDTGSAVKGGDLGYFSRGKMVKPFEDKVFSMKKGDVSDIVTTDFGFHIIQLVDKKPKAVQDLAAVETQIATKLLKKSKEDSALEELKELVKTGSTKQVEAGLKKSGLKWEETGEFALNQASAPKLGDDERLIDPVLNLKPGTIHNEVLASRGSNYLLKLKKLSLVDGDLEKAPKNEGGRVVFDEWFKDVQSTAQIKPNDKLVAGQ